MSVQFQKYCENQTYEIEIDEINNITQSNNENHAPQESETNIFKKHENENINVSNSDLIIPNKQDNKKDDCSLTKSLLSKCCPIWIVLIICIYSILFITLALNTENKKFKSK
jgi:hypothetical protein